MNKYYPQYYHKIDKVRPPPLRGGERAHHRLMTFFFFL